MPKPSPPNSERHLAQLRALGGALRAQRKALRVSATVAAEAAGVSRVTLHRIEKGEPSVTVGAWCNAASAVGMQLQLCESAAPAKASAQLEGWWPVRVVLADYPQLKALSWHVRGVEELTPVEAYDIYERNARHLDLAAMSASERALWQALQAAFGRVEHV